MSSYFQATLCLSLPLPALPLPTSLPACSPTLTRYFIIYRYISYISIYYTPSNSLRHSNPPSSFLLLVHLGGESSSFSRFSSKISASADPSITVSLYPLSFWSLCTSPRHWRAWVLCDGGSSDSGRPFGLRSTGHSAVFADRRPITMLFLTLQGECIWFISLWGRFICVGTRTHVRMMGAACYPCESSFILPVWYPLKEHTSVHLDWRYEGRMCAQWCPSSFAHTFFCSYFCSLY